MQIPENLRDRHALYRNKIRQIDMASRTSRRSKWRRMRSWLLLGSDSGSPVRHNAIEKLVNISTAHLFAPERVRFGVILPPHYGDAFIEEEDGARLELQRLWNDTDTGLVALSAVRWAHAMDTLTAKVIVDRNVPTLTILPDPSDIGVLQEDIDDFDRQEAICHFYTMSLPAYIRMVTTHPDATYRKALIAEAEEHATPIEGSGGADFLPPTVQRLILAQASPNMIGQVNYASDTSLAMPQVREPVVPLAELWIWDDAEQDYRVVKNFLPTERILWDPINPLVPGEHPFHPLTYNRVPGYGWGVPAIESVLPLQALLAERLDQIDYILRMNYRPPYVGIGFTGILEEKMEALREPGGFLPIPPGPGNTDIKPVVPQMPPDAFAEVQEIERMMAAQFGLPPILHGQSEPGVRSGEQAAVLATLSSGPTFSRAMVVEDWVESITTQMLRLQRRVMSQTLRKVNGDEWWLSQMPNDFVVRVSAHSSSPVYSEQIVQKVALAKQWGAIDNEDAIRLLNLPHDELLVAKARKLAEAAAKRAERMLETKEKEAEAKRIKAIR